jgi:hypothetical protein
MHSIGIFTQEKYSFQAEDRAGNHREMIALLDLCHSVAKLRTIAIERTPLQPWG